MPAADCSFVGIFSIERRNAMPCNCGSLLKNLICLIIPSPIHIELDLAIDNVEELLVASPVLLQQAKDTSVQRWQMFAAASLMTANTLAARWKDDRFAENMVAFYLAGLRNDVFPRVLHWMGTLGEQDWDDFLEIMKINPGMQEWLTHHRQPIPASRVAPLTRKWEPR